MPTPLTTLPLNPREHWPFFHAVSPVSSSDRELIAALDEPSAQRVWDEVVGQPIPATVVVQHGWICDLSVPFVWMDAWNGRADGWARGILRPALGWPDDEEVLFVERPRRALKTRFDVFLRAWRAFLIEDKGRCSSAESDRKSPGSIPPAMGYWGSGQGWLFVRGDRVHFTRALEVIASPLRAPGRN